jgi:drug/metabolite transporter (DMT)-like permease
MTSGQHRAMAAPAKTAPTTPPARRTTALVQLSLAMLAWGVTGVVAKSVDMGGMALAAYRTAVGAVVLVLILHLSGRRLTWRAFRLGAIGGVLLGLDLVLFFSAVKLTTVANATVIAALQPALVILISGPLLHEKVVKGALPWALAGLGGTVVVIFGASGAPDWSVKGDLLAVLALLAWTGYFIATRMIRGQLGALEYSTVTAIVSALVAWPAAAVFGQDLSWPTWESWGWIVALAVGAGIGGHFLMSVSIPHLPLWVSSTMTLSIPVISTATAAIFLDEQVSGMQLAGMTVVLVSLAFAIRVSTANGPAPDALGAAVAENAVLVEPTVLEPAQQHDEPRRDHEPGRQ